MDTNSKNFFINIISGLFTAIVVLYLDKNGFTSPDYIVFGLYIFLIFLVVVNIFRKKEIKNIGNPSPDKEIKIYEKQNFQTKLIEIGKFKWKTDIEDIKVHPIPYCAIHETILVEGEAIFACPAIISGCGAELEKADLSLNHDAAKSIIERQINKNLLTI